MVSNAATLRFSIRQMLLEAPRAAPPLSRQDTPSWSGCSRRDRRRFLTATRLHLRLSATTREMAGNRASAESTGEPRWRKPFSPGVQPTALTEAILLSQAVWRSGNGDR